MKKLLAVAILGLGVTANAGGIWDMVKNSTSDGTIQTKQYTIEVAGTNTRGYVMNIPDMKSMCFMTYSSKGIPALDCKTYKEIGIK
jgi:hypothetical protein